MKEPHFDPDSPALVAYRVGQLEKAQKEGFDKLEKKLDDLVSGFVTMKEYVALEKRVTKLEGWLVWGIRLVVGAVVTGVLAIVFKVT